MSEYLVVRLAAESSNAAWVVLDSAGHRVSQPASGPLSEIGPAAENRRVILLVPGLSVVAARASLPVKSQARLQQMLPYSLEDTVAEDVERLHFAAGPRNDAGDMAVAIVARDLLDDWLAQCAEAGFEPSLVYSETEGVPETPGSLTLVLEGDRTYGRGADQTAFVLEGLALGDVLDVLQTDGEAESDVRHIVLYTDDAGHRRYEAELPALQNRTSSIDVQLLSEGPLPRFGSTLINRPGCNLLQGAYAPKSNWGAMFRPWRLAAGLLLGLAALTMLAEGVRYWSLSRQDQALTALLETGCQQSFQATRLSVCQTEIQRRLSPSGAAAVGDGGERGFLVTLAAFSEARNADSRIEALSFRNGVMDLRVQAPSVPVLDEIARNVGAGGEFQVNIQSANPTDGGVEGRLQIVGLPR